MFIELKVGLMITC